ncbi:MAG: hypothetical protein GY898_10740 [Proteobacteria bacterium]|nr:hypothetical protein [Pseudomonadota bacterium]
MTGRIKRLLRNLIVPGSIRAREEDRWCHADPFDSGSYNFQFLRSRSDGDFVRHPDLLWSPNPYWTARSGLNAHLREIADRLGGSVWSDVLLVLHPRDRARTQSSLLESWDRAAEAELATCFERLVRTQGFVKAAGERPFRLKVLADGDEELGATLGLQPGEFATALLPNLYLGPTSESAPLVEVFVAPAGDGRFASVGTFYSDQMAFTVGAHALDNHLFEAFGDSAVYTVHRFPGEPGLHHKLGGEQSDRLALRTGSAHGVNTVRVVDIGRDKTLLEVMLVAVREAGTELPVAGERAGRVVGASDLPDLPFAPLAAPADGCTILPEDLDLGSVGAFSIIPDALPTRVRTLSERGFLFQRVHFGGVMRGYTMELDRSGTISPKAADPVVRVEVRGERLLLEAVGREVSLDGRPLRAGESVALSGAEHTIAWRGGEATYESMRKNDRRWPYLGRIGTPRRSTPLADGETWSVGRDREACDVALPDRLTTANILWKDGAAGAGHVEVRGGRVPKARFRTDAILVASHAAQIDLTGPVPSVANASTTCPLYIVRTDGKAIRIQQGEEVSLGAGDELLVGNSAFVLVTPSEEVASLAAAVVAPVAVTPELPDRLTPGRGRRPRVGGASGQIVQANRTYGAVLGISPASDLVPVQPMERDINELPSVPDLEMPTDQLPSLSLDPTILDETDAYWLLGGGGAEPMGAAMTVHVDESDAAAPSATPTVPRGLRIPQAPVPEEPRFRRRSPAMQLPSFGLPGHAPVEAFAAPSLGD